MKKLYGIRHIRYWYLSYRFWSWWENIGHRLGAFPNPSDLDYLEKVWRGEA